MSTLTERILDWTQTYCDSLTENYKQHSIRMYAGSDSDYSKRWLSKCFYDPVFHATNTHTGFISQASIDKRIENKKNNKKHQPCYDHVTTPQFLLRFLVDCKQDIFNISKEGFNEFLYWFKLATSVVEVTNPENTAVRQFTKFRNGNYKIYQPSDKKYKKANIILCERPADEKQWINAIPTDKTIEFSQDFLEYEKKFLCDS